MSEMTYSLMRLLTNVGSTKGSVSRQLFVEVAASLSYVVVFLENFDW